MGGDYDFWIDGEFSHCGGTSVTLAKVDGSWTIANWMWTVEKDNCQTDPANDQLRREGTFRFGNPRVLPGFCRTISHITSCFEMEI